MKYSLQNWPINIKCFHIICQFYYSIANNKGESGIWVALKAIKSKNSIYIFKNKTLVNIVPSICNELKLIQLICQLLSYRQKRSKQKQFFLIRPKICINKNLQIWGNYCVQKLGYIAYLKGNLTTQSLSRWENNLRELRKIDPWVQSITSNSLTALTMQ